MKTLKKINLLNLGQTEMAKREEKLLQGGRGCACGCSTTCGCKYAGPQEGLDDSFYGGSSHADNGEGTVGVLVESATIHVDN